MNNIRVLGASTTILATDLGQSKNPHVDEGLLRFVEKVAQAGFKDKDVEQMVSRNPAQLLGVA